MEMIFIMLPAAVLLGAVGVGFLVWAVKSGQFEDLEGEKHRIFFEDED